MPLSKVFLLPIFTPITLLSIFIFMLALFKGLSTFSFYVLLWLSYFYNCIYVVFHFHTCPFLKVPLPVVFTLIMLLSIFTFMFFFKHLPTFHFYALLWACYFYNCIWPVFHFHACPFLKVPLPAVLTLIMLLSVFTLIFFKDLSTFHYYALLWACYFIIAYI